MTVQNLTNTLPLNFIEDKTKDSRYQALFVLLLEKVNIDDFQETDIFTKLNNLFYAVRKAKDSELRAILDEFFNLTINRTL